MKTLHAKTVGALAALLCAASAQAAIVVSFTPSSQHVNVGDIVSVDMRISGLGAEILSAFDFNVLWNANVMGSHFRGIDATSAQDQLGSAYQADPVWAIDTTDPGNWGIQASAVASNDDVSANQADSFLLAHMLFSADADGVTSVTLGADLDFERNFVGLDPLTSMDVTVGSACVAVGTGNCTVPEPSSYGLAALALLGAAAPAAWRRRRNR